MGCTSSTAAGGGTPNAPMRNAANILSASGAIAPDTPVALLIPPMGWDAHIPALTMSQVEREREAFWDTRVQGRTEFWNGLQLALLSDDDATRGAILYSMGSTALYPAEDGSGIFCYDESGSRYDVPWSVFYLPSSIINDSNFSTPSSHPAVPAHAPASAATTTAAAPAAAHGAGSAPSSAHPGSAPATAEHTPLSAAATPSHTPGQTPSHTAAAAAGAAGAAGATPSLPSPPQGPTVRFHVLTSDGGRLTLDAPLSITKKDLVRVVKVKFGLSPVQQRIVVRGNLIEDNDMTLSEMGVQAEHTVQVFIAPKAKVPGQGSAGGGKRAVG